MSYERAQVAVAAVHIVGSNNSLAPWTGNTTATPEQTVEVLGRTVADIGLIRDTFRLAATHRDRTVVLLTQADMFDTTVTTPDFADYYAFQPIVQAVAQEPAAFHGPVYLFNGDSHVDHQDNPLAAGSTWLSGARPVPTQSQTQNMTLHGLRHDPARSQRTPFQAPRRQWAAPPLGRALVPGFLGTGGTQR